MSGYRLTRGGSFLDRSKTVAFTFDTRPVDALAGDTVASALLANGRRTVARSFKYHRPRGVFSAGPEEPNALVTVGPAGAREPNIAATMVEVTEGLSVAAQNGWPTVGTDIQAVNGLLARFLSAGFYYKTFMGPTRKSWMAFEPLIRRAAGLGRLEPTADTVRRERVNAYCDLLVVGAGPAGVAAAITAAWSGARVILAEESARLGGDLHEARATIDGDPATAWLAEALDELARHPNVTVKTRTTVVGLYDGNVATAIERIGPIANPAPALPRYRHITIHPKRTVLATGAVERPVVFAGNDLPGVMLAGAIERLAVRYGVAAGRRIVLSGATDTMYRAAITLAETGANVVAVADARPSPPDALVAALTDRGVAHHAGALVVRARGSGTGGVSGAEIAHLAPGQDAGDDGVGDGLLAAGRRIRQISTDVIGVSGGWSPLVQLASQAGAPPVWDDSLQAFLPGDAREAWVAAGQLAGVAAAGPGGLADAFASGAEAAWRQLDDIGIEAKPLAVSVEEEFASPDAAATPIFAVRARDKRGKAFVDLQNDVTTADVDLAHQEGYQSVEHLKRYTTLGMATDQGRTSNVNGLALLAARRGLPIPAVGSTRFRPPAAPVPLGAIAGRETGEHLRPVRRTALHDWHIAAAADMMPTGQWLRARVYRRPGESVTDAYVRETRAVRETAGIVDVTTLGKIAVTGPDAANFLNRVYVNGFAKLPVGKARYGLMLREDGFVFDDGTTWRLGETEFLMTTTTANAAAVLAWLEWLLAVDFPQLQVAVASVTDAWAGLAIAGPLSRAILEALLQDTDLSDETCPFMGIVRGRIGGRPVLVARLSFSGELAYEVMCGSRDGLAVWSAVHDYGLPLGLVPYGTETLGALRTEKGHVSGPELDGRTTLDDLGLGRMASTKKVFVGKALMDRPAMTAPDRLQLVGLRALEDRPIRAGSHLIARGEAPAGPARSEGHVTSPTYSPALGCHIALALLAGGRARTGEELFATFPLDEDGQPVRVVSPHFLDPDGVRLKPGAPPLFAGDEPAAMPVPAIVRCPAPDPSDPFGTLPAAGASGGLRDAPSPIRIAPIVQARFLALDAFVGKAEAFDAHLAAGGPVPAGPGRFVERDGGVLATISPGRLVALGSAANGLALASGAGTFAHTDLSHARAGVRITGGAAADVLLTGIALDLHSSVFGPGQCAATRIGHITGLVMRRTEDVFDIHVGSTFSRAFGEWLIDAATATGWEIGTPVDAVRLGDD